DWSSDVCSSDLPAGPGPAPWPAIGTRPAAVGAGSGAPAVGGGPVAIVVRCAGSVELGAHVAAVRTAAPRRTGLGDRAGAPGHVADSCASGRAAAARRGGSGELGSREVLGCYFHRAASRRVPGGGAGPAAELAAGARGQNKSTASTAPSRATPAAAAKAAWKPSVIAAGPAPGPARATAPLDNVAIPSALPMWNELPARPAASPDSSSAAPVSAAIWAATNALPRPAPNTSRPKHRSGHYRPSAPPGPAPGRRHRPKSPRPPPLPGRRPGSPPPGRCRPRPPTAPSSRPSSARTAPPSSRAPLGRTR